jgi:purine nucleosidase
VHQYPNQITIYAAGPMTNLALAISIDPEFPRLAKELVLMGGSLSPDTTDPEFVNTPRREFNLWFDPEAAHIVLRAPWKKVTATTVDISVKTRLTAGLISQIKASSAPAAQYVAKYARTEGEYNYLWDELAAAAWLDPGIITKRQTRYMDVNLSHGYSYGDTITWGDENKPKVEVQPVEIQVDLDKERFYKLFLDLLSAATPRR